MRASLALIALTAAAALPAHALTVFSDNFEAAPMGLNVAPAGWTVTNGTVDVLGPGTFASLCLGGGRCLDLDGSTGKAGLLSQTLSLNAGWTYTLSFDMAGNRRGAGTESVMVRFGSASTVLSFADSSSAAPWQSFALNFTPSTSGNFSFSFANAGGDNQGAMLDNVSVTTVPEPGSVLLMGAGLLALAGLKRRRG